MNLSSSLLQGKFFSETSAIPAWNLTKKLDPAKITVHIVQKYEGSGVAGTSTASRSVFAGVQVNSITYGHEIGHVLNFAAKKAGNQASHDIGPWPNSWKASKKTGLIYEAVNPNESIWMRRSWYLSNTTAVGLQ